MLRINTSRLHSALLACAAAAALLLVGCSKADQDRSVGQQIDSAVASAEKKTEAAGSEIRKEVAQVRQEAGQASADLKQRAQNAANNVADKVQDATITASVNAELAKDGDLSALRIDVDTVGGKVLLQGTAPSSEARERATRLAADVQGVRSVDNQLEIRS